MQSENFSAESANQFSPFNRAFSGARHGETRACGGYPKLELMRAFGAHRILQTIEERLIASRQKLVFVAENSGTTYQCDV